MSLLRDLLLAASRSAWLRRQASRRRFVRGAVSRFMPGETLGDAVRAARALQAQGIGSILTFLGENVSDRAEAEEVVVHYLGVLDRIQREGLDAEISVKLTQLGLDVGTDLACENARRVAARASELGTRVWIDMESTAYTDATLQIFRRLREANVDVGVCLQSYLRRTPSDVESLLPLGGAIRLVKGAYREPPALAFPRKRDVDENFFSLATRLLGEEARRCGIRTIVGTHDPDLIGRVEGLIQANGAGHDRLEFAMMYGIGRTEVDRLSRAGYRTRVLISYGTHWFPWYMRRLAERPANLWFVVRRLFGG